MDEDHISEENFLMEFFGFYARDFGNPDQYFVDNPQEIIAFVKECEINKKPAFISVQPRRAHHKNFGIEKLFYDFDYADKTFLKKLAIKHPSKPVQNWILKLRKDELYAEVCKFVFVLTYKRIPNLQPMIVKTRKGYHIYIYLDKVYQLDGEEKFVKAVYATLTDTLKTLYENFYQTDMMYSDPSVREDIYRIARIPLSIHEASGQKCIFMKLKVSKDGRVEFESDKIRGLGFFKNRSLREDDIIKAIKITRQKVKTKIKELETIKEKSKDNWESEHGYIGKVRPCFQKALAGGEMGHQQRLALLTEAWYSGIKDFAGLVNVFRPLHDFDGDNPTQSICRYQCQWFLDREGWKIPPYTCDTIQKLGWCIEKECKTYLKRKENE